jgi:acid phosphatase type 7
VRANRKWLRLLVVPTFMAYACTGNSNSPVTPSPPIQPIPPVTTPPPPIAATAFLVGAGDIADCRSVAQGGNLGVASEATAKLIDKLPEAWVFTMGDNQYFFGSSDEYNNCYRPRWGRFLSRTYPSPGNHEYENGTNGAGYFDFFGGRAVGDNGGYYSYTLGNWHVIALNSGPALPISVATAQYQWLARDLEANKNSATARCTLAYWHHPVFTSGPSAGSNGIMRDVYELLFRQGVDVIVNGHDHLYERFFPQDHLGVRSPAAGVTEYVVGTGGAPLYDFGPQLPNSAAKLKTFGVIYFTLKDVGWDSVFIEAGTEARLDPSIGNLCH